MILIFGGTTEGRLAVDICEQAGKPFYYSTKSALQKVELHHGVRLTGAMDASEMQVFCREHGIACIIDAAHPFAENLHQTIATVGLPVIRLQRSFGEHVGGVTYCKDYADAMEKLKEQPLRCLLALSGVNTMAKLAPYWKTHKTIFRILSRAESMELVQQNQFPTSNLLFYPADCTLPTKAAEKTLMASIGCDAILTKESGDSGGFDAKVQAALELGLKVFVVEHPELPDTWTYVTGKHGLRRAIEQLAPAFFPLKTGFTTGACATAAVKAALLSMLYDDTPEEVAFALPDGEIMTIPVTLEEKGVASVVKDFSDDPDVTKGCKITARLTPGSQGIRFLKGEGVGTVTLPGLGIPVGEPAVNSTPRQMMMNEIRALTSADFDVTIAVEHGEELAQKTFNPRVGVIGGISIIGTSGIVSPLSHEAFIQSITRELEVAKAIGCREIGLVSGLKSEEALRREKDIRCIHYGNFIGESLKAAHQVGFEKVTLAIMIGKAVKLAEGHLDTHSHKVVMNKAFLKEVAGPDAGKIDQITLARELWGLMPVSFFERIKSLCYNHCKTVFPEGELEIRLICDIPS